MSWHHPGYNHFKEVFYLWNYISFSEKQKMVYVPACTSESVKCRSLREQSLQHVNFTVQMKLDLVIWRRKNCLCSRLHIQVTEMYIIERTKFATCKFHCSNYIKFRYLTKKKLCMFQVTHPSR